MFLSGFLHKDCFLFWGFLLLKEDSFFVFQLIELNFSQVVNDVSSSCVSFSTRDFSLDSSHIFFAGLFYSGFHGLFLS